VKPLAIIQARLASTRLPNKMLLPLGGKPVLWWAWYEAMRWFRDQVVIATTAADVAAIRAAVPRAYVYGWEGPENDVLGRFHACAQQFLGHDIIYRITPDDFPIDVNREWFTPTQLDYWHTTVTDPRYREHIGLLLPKRIELNTEADYEAAKRVLEQER
jgi:hypothetical protein